MKEHKRRIGRKVARPSATAPAEPEAPSLKQGPLAAMWELRRRLGWRQSDLAAKLHCGLSTLNRAENGQSTLSRRLATGLQQVAAEYGQEDLYRVFGNYSAIRIDGMTDRPIESTYSMPTGSPYRTMKIVATNTRSQEFMSQSPIGQSPASDVLRLFSAARAILNAYVQLDDDLKASLKNPSYPNRDFAPLEERLERLWRDLNSVLDDLAKLLVPTRPTLPEKKEEK